MDIYIDKKAEDYIKSNSKDNSIHVYIKRVGGGWCAGMQPSVEMGEPSNVNSYEMHLIGDIKVYVLSGVRVSKKGLRIGLSRFFWIKALYADGLMIM